LRDGIPAETFVIDRVHVNSSGALQWNGVPIDPATLRKYMTAIAMSRPQPFVILDPDPGADCAAVEAAREAMARSGTCSPGGCGEGHGDWNYGPPVQINTSSDAYQEAVRAADAANRSR
jgi:hypothetical protein